MTARNEGVPPQGIRTPRGRRGGVTVPGPSLSLSNNGLSTALLPSAVDEAIIDGLVLRFVFRRAEKASSDGDLTTVVACVEDFLGLLPRYRPPR